MTRIGFIGAGRWATPYADAVKELGATVAGIYAPDETAARLAERTGGTVSPNAQAVVELCDLLVIGSPTDTHEEYLELASKHGRKVFCSSPIGTSVDGGASAQGYASFPFRTKPEYIKLKETVADGSLGDIGMIRIGLCCPKPEGWRADKKRSGGLLLELGVHGLDLLEWIGGPIERVYSQANEAEGLAYQVLVARLASGAIAHIELSWAEASGVAFDYYEVAGSKGLLDFDSRKELELVVECRESGVAGRSSLVNRKLATLEMQQVLKAVAGESTELVTVADAISQLAKVLQIAEGVNGQEAVRV